jgi:hypothetical protein
MNGASLSVPCLDKKSYCRLGRESRKVSPSFTGAAPSPSTSERRPNSDRVLAQHHVAVRTGERIVEIVVCVIGRQRIK